MYVGGSFLVSSNVLIMEEALFHVVTFYPCCCNLTFFFSFLPSLFCISYKLFNFTSVYNY